MLFNYDVERSKSQCTECGRWMNDGNETAHLQRVHGYDELRAMLDVLDYKCHQLEVLQERLNAVNEAIWNMTKVAEEV